MFNEYDSVRLKETGEVYFIIVIDEGPDGVIYGLELEDQYAGDWFRWCTEEEIEPIDL